MADAIAELMGSRLEALMAIDTDAFKGPSEARQYFERMASHEVEICNMGVMVLDVGKVIEGHGFELEEDKLSVPGERFIRSRLHLSPEELSSVQLGGIGNVSLPLGALGVSNGVVGFIGADLEGGYATKGLYDNNVNANGLIVKPEYRTDVTIKLKNEGGSGRPPLVFCEDAGKFFDLEDADVKRNILLANSKIYQISYSGLFPQGADADGGKKLARGIRWIQETLDALVMVDTHTYPDEPERYECLRPSLGVTDMFVCSDDEINLIVPQYNISSGDDTESRKEAFFGFLEENYCSGKRAKLYAVTSPEKCSAMYYANGETQRFEVENWFYTDPKLGEGQVKDLTGAGDSWRAGHNAYILNHLEDYKTGKLNVEEAVGFANLTARLYISGDGTEAFESNSKHYQYGDLINLVTKSKPTIDLRPIVGIYEAMDKAA